MILKINDYESRRSCWPLIIGLKSSKRKYAISGAMSGDERVKGTHLMRLSEKEREREKVVLNKREREWEWHKRICSLVYLGLCK